MISFATYSNLRPNHKIFLRRRQHNVSFCQHGDNRRALLSVVSSFKMAFEYAVPGGQFRAWWRHQIFIYICMYTLLTRDVILTIVKLWLVSNRYRRQGNCTLQILWEAITCSCPPYLLLTHKLSYLRSWSYHARSWAFIDMLCLFIDGEIKQHQRDAPFVFNTHDTHQEQSLNYTITYMWRPVQNSRYSMMTSSNGNIFPVTGHLYGEFTGNRWIPRTKASDAELWGFLWSASE